MSTDALKIELINQITGITDRDLLEAVRTLLKTQSDDNIYILNDQERSAIAAGRDQIAKGDFKSNQAVHEEVSKWLQR